jgi:hypothetical protein
MEFGDAFQLAATLEALRGRRRGGSLRRSWTEERVLHTCAAGGCDATFINKQRTQIYCGARCRNRKNYLKRRARPAKRQRLPSPRVA